MQKSIRYLNSYTQVLKKTNTPDQLYGDVLAWQFAQHFPPTLGSEALGVHVQRTISEQYLKMPAGHVGAHDRAWLRHDHLPTTAIGGFNGLLVVAAMPSWNEKLNAEEMKHRSASPNANRAFCERLFAEYPDHAARLTWWKRLVRFAYRVMDDGEPPKDTDLIAWAANGMVGNVDLIPFHCQDDKLTRHVLNGQRLQETGTLLGAMHAMAAETLRMAARLRPKAILVVSRSGAYLASELAAAIGATRSDDLVVEFDDSVVLGEKKWPWLQTVHLHRFVFPLEQGGAPTMYTFAGQLFSTQANLTKLHAPLARAIREDLRLPSGRQQRLIELQRGSAHTL